MKTQDLFKLNRQARRLNEGLEKTFGKRLNLENFDLQQLQDARNKIRTQISQVRSESGFNENLENDAYHQAHFMLDALNAEIAEREEIVADASTAELDEEAAEEQVDEKAPPGAKAERMVKHIKKGYADDGKLTDKEKGIAYATAWKQHNKDKNESVETGDNMTKLREGEIQQASAIVTAKTMVDRVGRWIEELSGMENDTLLTLGDSIRDEMGQEQAKAFISAVAPAIQQALENLKATRETLSTGMRTLTGEQQPAEMLGGEPAAEEPAMDMAEPDLMNAGDDLDALGAEDDFAAAEPAAGPDEAGRAQRESINFQNRLMKVLAG
jgi:hypothetical protein